MKFTTNDQNPYSWFRVEDDGCTWVLRDREDSPMGEQRLSWIESMPDGLPLTHSRYEHLLDTMQEVVIGFREGDTRGARKRGDTALVQYQLARAVMAIARWMLRRGTTRFSYLTAADFDEFKLAVRGGVLALDDPISRVRELAAEYQRDGRSPPMYRHGNREFFRREAFLAEAGLPPKVSRNNAALSYELSRIQVEIFHLERFANGYTEARYRKGPPEQETLSVTSLIRYLTGWEVLWEYRGSLTDPLSFNPFEELCVATMATDLGEDTDRTPNIPPRIALQILDQSIRWITIYGPELLKLRDELLAVEPMLQEQYADRGTRTRKREHIIRHFEEKVTRGYGEPWPISAQFHKGGLSEGALDLQRALNTYLAAACFVVIGAFSARRHREIGTLRDHKDPDLSPTIGDPGRRYLTIWIEKTRRQWDQVPVPEIVVLAVDLLQRLSEGAREKTRTDFLFQFLNWSGEALTFDVKRYVPEFAAWLQQQVPVQELSGGEPLEPWRLLPHQLRRFFAITYFHRWEHADLAALSWVLRHNSLEATLHYCMESVPGAATTIHEVQHERTVNILTGVALGEHAAGGGFVNRYTTEIQGELDAELERLRIVLNESITVLGEHQVRPIIDKYAQEYGIELRPAEHGECTCRNTPEDTAIANCRQPELLAKGLLVSLGPDKGFAKPSVCGGCAHFMVLGHHAPCWKRHQRTLQEEATSLRTPPILRSNAEQQLAKVEKFIASNPGVL